MLEKINKHLGIFFEDCYKEWAVREYARKTKISPPTASKILKDFAKQNLLKSRQERGFLLFRANRENKTMEDLSRIYWKGKLKSLTEYIEKEIYPNAMVLFGSLSKLEVTEKSDIDIAIFTKIKKDLKLNDFEKKLKRKIQIFIYENIANINKSLKLAILNGYILRGYLS